MSENKTITRGKTAKRRNLKCDFHLTKILKGRVLGEGGFGTAHLYERAVNDLKSSARYLLLHKKKQYVVKTVNPEENGQVERKYIERAKNEAYILKYLNRTGCHPFILCYVGCSETPDNFYIVTKFNPGYVTLQDYVFQDAADAREYFKEEWGVFSRIRRLFYTEETIRGNIMRNLCEGLAEIHRRKVIHKDVKPQNILVKPTTGRIKYIDFGLSCIMEKGGECTYGETPLYIPPDLHFVKRPETKHYLYYDKWVLGVCLYFVYFRENSQAIRHLYQYLDVDGERARYEAFKKGVYEKGDPHLRKWIDEVDAHCGKIGCWLVSDLVREFV